MTCPGCGTREIPEGSSFPMCVRCRPEKDPVGLHAWVERLKLNVEESRTRVVERALGMATDDQLRAEIKRRGIQ